MPVKRIDDQVWSYVPDQIGTWREVQVETPEFVDRSKGFVLTTLIKRVFDRWRVNSPDSLGKGIVVEVSGQGDVLDARWIVRWENPADGCCFKQFQSTAFTRSYPDLGIGKLVVERDQLPFFTGFKFHTVQISEKVDLPTFSAQWDSQASGFQDAFTSLAAQAFQFAESRFVSQPDFKADTRYVMGERGELKLVRTSTDEENSKVIDLYSKWVIEEFGKRRALNVQDRLGFDLSQMKRRGEPLTPEHIFKMNMGLCTVDLQDLEDFYWRVTHDGKLSKREVRSRLTKGIIGRHAPDSFRDFQTQEWHNRIVDALMPTESELERAFCGRKIEGRAVAGAKTQGDGAVPDPSYDLFELFHIFPDLRKEDWNNYHELLAHIVVKKQLFTKGACQDWRVGLVIPAPSDRGMKRWMVVSSVLNDNGGSLNYGLEPLRKLDPLPMIKLYRSTTFQSSQMSPMDTVAADLNPYGSPGTLNPGAGDKYELIDFDKSTIPLWMGYTLANDPKRALSEYTRATGQTIAYENENDLSSKLLKRAEELGELPRQKQQRDIVFVGHSLGGGLAQDALCRFAIARGRIPCRGFRFVCHTFDAPSIDTKSDKAFAQFGKEHGKLIEKLGPKWLIKFDFEYGDAVPLWGESHLGTNGNTDWIESDIQIRRPVEGSRAPEITTAPTHLRRFGLLRAERDYTVTKIAPKDLYAFDHAWLLTGKQRHTFGLRFLTSPKLVELARRIIAVFTRIWFWIANKLYSRYNDWKPRVDREGVFFRRLHA
jgi:hypothetical protein